MWFDSSHIFKFQTIPLDDIKGYVLPHAGTAISVINAYDEFGPDIPVAVSSGSYVLASNQ